MTRILAVDTTAEFGSIALIEGGETVSEELIHAPEGFGQVLFGRLEALLARAGWKLKEIDCFAAAAGPGSFTGVRVGLAAVKGLAEALKRPAVGVSNLQAVASFGSAPLRAAVLDARRGQIYGAVYDAALKAVTPEVVTSLPQWLASLPEGELEFISTDFTPFRGALAGTRFENAPVLHAPRALAGAIGRIAAERLSAGAAQDPAALDANYVRRSDAEMFWKE
ncbi:MAG TPA: tRNA (adenosine(37)-N6)-threonylcarbamoyltransferase complex dimerization subunit type 1 TsaB [Bryobacteraceae bacterium]|nr:tRNA (adenosine(37)-N6)-threonylcarbamoyltransferase complex dimerization subunit type 1 TsaB [Bryobacteraceae bacterium]HOQ47313.1 tRNA (adenosine(37)-N6)-threonylcarbamoyltransferase complex dimerization subunit type 1 TsaB [Bryobacteraceae bacterium]HPU73902.1 tRNA (adenosine(37)-N6)-threonylcarbamoyltransferase complex dimerization subunit type 1 TsaB [Bryobacteraceae bacterium]